MDTQETRLLNQPGCIVSACIANIIAGKRSEFWRNLDRHGQIEAAPKTKGMHATPDQAAGHHDDNAGDIEQRPEMTGPRLLGVNTKNGNRDALHTQRARFDQYLALEHKAIPGDIAMLDFLKKRGRKHAKSGLGIGDGISRRP